jgi:hypothetical protein
MKVNFSIDTSKKKPATPAVENLDRKKPKSAKVGSTIQEQQVFRARQSILNWRRALTCAESVHLPNRLELVRIYQDIILDAHLSSLIQTRKINVLSKSFNLKDKDGEIDENMTALFQSAWFRKFTDKALDSIFWGTTLIEFGDIVDDNLTDVSCIPYENLNPEKQIVKKYIESPEMGSNYNEKPFVDWNIEVKEQENFGLLNKCIPLIIWKKNALGAWSIRSDIFGMPLRIGKTDTRDEESRGKMIEMMQNMDVATWGVFDLEDEIQLVESTGTSGHEIYSDLIQMSNSELSKLILGQTGTTDEKSFVGAAEVHERVSEDYTRADMAWFTLLVNDVLIPKLTKLGLFTGESTFGFDTKEVLSILDQWEVDKELIKTVNVDNEYLMQKYGTKITEGSAQALLNGAQVTSMVDIITGVGLGTIPKESAKLLIVSSFGIEEDVASSIIEPIEITGKPEEPKVIAPANVSVVNDISKMYKGFFDKDEDCC